MAKYQVGEFEFVSKAAVKTLLSEELKSRVPGDIVTDPFVSGLLTALVGEHVDAMDKIGPGIEHWVVCSNVDLGFPGKGFRIKQIGSDELVEFGYGKVITPPSEVGRVAEALTQEAIEITRQVRTDAFQNGPAKCADSGAIITDKKDAKAVHRHPVRAELHRQFLESEGLEYEDVALTPATPARSGRRLADRELAQRWCDFQLARIDGMEVVKIRREES
ncbi:hypothetical protein LJ756_01155 [Arthrobacter sp. zg-Y411]|uniref:hypothetical protein n=1 Tax=Arthrobacter zhangbolii TaxID=2886936 RepID=UPI001D15BF3C|nr:hypothetical protein [Arthrobacter zhangbolii]MCC3293223.1 hypothetical protein [Arthrobacter zhangbolii]